MGEPYSAPVTACDPAPPRPLLSVVAMPEVEQDQRDAELRGLLARYYAETWALARAQANPLRTTQ